MSKNQEAKERDNLKTLLSYSKALKIKVNPVVTVWKYLRENHNVQVSHYRS